MKIYIVFYFGTQIDLIVKTLFIILVSVLKLKRRKLAKNRLFVYKQSVNKCRLKTAICHYFIINFNANSSHKCFKGHIERNVTHYGPNNRSTQKQPAAAPALPSMRICLPQPSYQARAADLGSTMSKQ